MQIDKQILNTDKVICRHISNLSNSTRDNITQFRQFRTCEQHCEFISKVDDEFKKIVEAVQDNKTIVDELEKIISQFKV